MINRIQRYHVIRDDFSLDSRVLSELEEYFNRSF